jgi:hypothetical protein
MVAPKVYNKTRDKNIPPNAVYIGRGSKWGNPFILHNEADRDKVIQLYETYLISNVDLLRDLIELKGKSLVCFCAPKSCHGDVLLKYANKEYCPHCGGWHLLHPKGYHQSVSSDWFNEEGIKYEVDLSDITFDNPVRCMSCDCTFTLGEE